MDPERQRRRDALLETALGLDAAGVAALLDEVSVSDPTLRQEVERLLAVDQQLAPTFLEAGARGWDGHPLDIGETVGRYVVQALIGTGGMSAVYRAHDAGIDRDVALKVLLPHGAGADRTKLFFAELKVLGAFRHDHVVRVYDFGEARGLPYLVMELLEGEDLAQAIAAQHCGDVRRKLDIARQLATALKDLHAAGIVHRDVKPANVFLETSGRVKLMDFGISREDGTEQTRTSVLWGTPEYLSPEQIQGQPATARSDIYAYGVLLVELFSGVRPFRGSIADVLYRIVHEPLDVRPLRTIVPSAVVDLIERLIAKDPNDRPESFVEIEQVLTREHAHGPFLSIETEADRERVDGQTLRTRLAAGALPVATAIAYARQMARELAAAHRQGVVHGALAPETIFIASDDRLRLVRDGEDSRRPTNGARTAYLAPEQAHGSSTDRRVDVFAFGMVLCEMLTGERPHGTNPPRLHTTNAAIPAWLDLIVTRCLTVDPANRFQSADDLSFAIDAFAAESDAAPTTRTSPGLTPSTKWLAGVGTVLLVMAGVVGLLVRPRAVADPSNGITVSSSIVLDGVPGIGVPGEFALSPDGRWLAYSKGNANDLPDIWVRSLATGNARALPDTSGGARPFWSPDSTKVGFDTVLAQDQVLKTVPIDGGPTVSVAKLNVVGQPSWHNNGWILVATGSPPVIQRVLATGGTPQPLSQLDTVSGETAHISPVWLPDGQHFLYAAVGTTGAPEAPRGVYLGTVGSTTRTLLVAGATNPQFGDGYLVFTKGRMLAAQRFDFDRRELSGSPVQLADAIAQGGPGGQPFGNIAGLSLGASGHALAYAPGAYTVRTGLVWFDRSGAQLGQLADDGAFRDALLSHDGTRASTVVQDVHNDVWVYDVRRRLRSRMTFGPTDIYGGEWSSDDRCLAVVALVPDQPFDLFERCLEGTGSLIPLVTDAFNKWPSDWSRDGKFLLYERAERTSNPSSAPSDLWVLSLADRKTRPFLTGPFDEGDARFSPDGHFVAYRSDESGRTEVYITTFPTPGEKIRVSTNGGDWPRWRGDGRELFYVEARNSIMAVPVGLRDGKLIAESPHPLFKTSVSLFAADPYDVMPDGKRFLVSTGWITSGSTTLTLVTNWSGLVERH
jgi:serine/threonine protein kinase/Tol biopolymer transport system component